MNLLLVGSDAREQALARRLAESARATRLFVAPGNAGTAGAARCQNVAIPATDTAALRDFARANEVGLTVVGPPEPLLGGVVDEFHAAGLPIFGPTRAAAEAVSRHAAAKTLMAEHHIPTAAAHRFDNYRAAIKHVMAAQSLPVIRVSGAPPGTGVYVPDCFNDAETALHEVYVEKRFGQAAPTVVIEERLEGPTLAVLALCDGAHYKLLPALQDGGALAPPSLAPPELLFTVDDTIIRRTVDALRARGTPYTGVLGAKLVLTAQGPRVREFTCTWSDEEALTLLPLMESDLLEVLLACTAGRLDEVALPWREQAA